MSVRRRPGATPLENEYLLFTLRIPVSKGTVTVHAYDGGAYHYPDTHHKIDVVATFQGRTVFQYGDTYCVTSVGTSIDGDEARELVCSLVAMRPGDTDEEYFASYTPEQVDFANAYGEEVSVYGERYKCSECGAVNGRSRDRWQGKRCKRHGRREPVKS